MALKDYRASRSNSNTSTMLGGGAAEVISTNKSDGKTTITAKLVMDCLDRSAGDEVVIHFASKTAGQIEDSLKRGMGTGAGSVIVLENCFKGQGDNEIVANWITTAISAAKKSDPESAHNRVQVERAFVTTPFISFNNPLGAAAQDEPRRITFSLTAETARMAVVGADNRAVRKTFDREFLRERLAQVPAADIRRAVRVSSIVTQPAYATVVDSVDAAIQVVEDTLSNNNAVALVRVVDDTEDVEMAYLRLPYQKPLDEYLKDLKEINLISQIPNEDLQANVESGKWKLEVIPAFDVPYLGDSLVRIVSDVLDKSPNAMRKYNITYGENSAGRAVDAVVVTSVTTAGDYFFFHDPVSVDRRTRTNLRYLKTANIQIDEPAPEEPANAPEQQAPASAPAAAAAPAADGGEEFDPTQYTIASYDDEDTAVSEFEQSAGNAARTRRNT